LKAEREPLKLTGDRKTVEQVSDGKVLSTHNGVPTVVDRFHYPVNINFTVYTPDFQNCKSGSPLI